MSIAKSRSGSGLEQNVNKPLAPNLPQKLSIDFLIKMVELEVETPAFRKEEIWRNIERNIKAKEQK